MGSPWYSAHRLDRTRPGRKGQCQSSLQQTGAATRERSGGREHLQEGSAHLCQRRADALTALHGNAQGNKKRGAKEASGAHLRQQRVDGLGLMLLPLERVVPVGAGTLAQLRERQGSGAAQHAGRWMSGWVSGGGWADGWWLRWALRVHEDSSRGGIGKRHGCRGRHRGQGDTLEAKGRPGGLWRGQHAREGLRDASRACAARTMRRSRLQSQARRQAQAERGTQRGRETPAGALAAFRGAGEARAEKKSHRKVPLFLAEGLELAIGIALAGPHDLHSARSMGIE